MSYAQINNHFLRGSAIKARSDTRIYKEVGVRSWFFTLCVFGKVCGVLPYVTKPFIFPSIPQSISMPIWSVLHVPPTVLVFVCLCVCRRYVDLAHRLSTIIHFLYFWSFDSPGEVKLEHSMSTISVACLSAVTHKHPLHDFRGHTTQVSWLPV